jgi:hypothetical protein
MFTIDIEKGAAGNDRRGTQAILFAFEFANTLLE